MSFATQSMLRVPKKSSHEIQMEKMNKKLKMFDAEMNFDMLSIDNFD